MRAKILAAALLFTLAGSAAPATAAPPTVEEAKALHTTVVDLNNKYTFGALGPNRFVAVHSTPLMRASFSAAYVKSWDRAMAKNKDQPVFDGDGLDGTQEVKKLAFVDASVDGDIVKATLIRYADGAAPEKETLRLKLVRENGKLKIDDIGDDLGDGSGLKWAPSLSRRCLRRKKKALGPSPDRGPKGLRRALLCEARPRSRQLSPAARR